MTVAARSFYGLSSHHKWAFIGNKKYEQYLVITVENNGGYLAFEITNMTTNKVEKLENPQSGTYEFLLEKGEKTQLVLKAKSAIGKYKIQKKTIKE